MAGKKWSDKELEILKEKYSNSNKDLLLKLLSDRTWAAIKLKAEENRIAFCQSKNWRVSANLEVLLNEEPISYYWMGFLLADGCFYKNRLLLSISYKDIEHLKKFASFIGYKKKIRNIYKKGKRYCGISVKDSFVCPKITKKFNIKPAKTYNAPEVYEFKDEFYYPLMIGFIDGDGSINKKDYGNSLEISNHKSWYNFLNTFIDRLSCKFNIKLSKPKFKKEKIVRIIIGRKKILDFLFEVGYNNLPVLNRKWQKLNLSLKGIKNG